jgi:hypothetical protein
MAVIHQLSNNQLADFMHLTRCSPNHVNSTIQHTNVNYCFIIIKCFGSLVSIIIKLDVQKVLVCKQILQIHNQNITKLWYTLLVSIYRQDDFWNRLPNINKIKTKLVQIRRKYSAGRTICTSF